MTYFGKGAFPFFFLLSIIISSCHKENSNDQQSRGLADSIAVLHLNNPFPPYLGFSLHYGDTISYPNQKGIVPDIYLDKVDHYFYFRETIFGTTKIILLRDSTDFSNSQNYYTGVNNQTNIDFSVANSYLNLKVNQIYALKSVNGDIIKLLILNIDSVDQPVKQQNLKYQLKFKWAKIK